MGPPEPVRITTPSGHRPRWSAVLRALREARGVTIDGWGARLGVSRKTVQRWERGERVPDPGAEASILTYCHDAGLFRTYVHGPLAGMNLTPELLQDLLAEARWRVDRGPIEAAPSGNPIAGVQVTDTPHANAQAPPSNLPIHLTSFVGRQREIAVVRRVQAETRLLTLTGAGGCGKTRLALALADELLWAYPHGVWFIDLAPLADSALLPQLVASALAVRPAGRQPVVEAVIDAIRDRNLLLLLDNCEHLLPRCAELAETLLRACPGMAIVATSRTSLGIGGEVVWRVPPMSVPSSTFQIPREPGPFVETGTLNLELEQADAVRLFVERARLQRPEFAATPADGATIVEICRRLDGMPLAIELAAARISVLSVGQIAARITDRFRLLTGGGRTALPRHQTLRGAMEWSFDLLSGQERAMLRALSVFAGGFPLDAAEAVCTSASVDGESTIISAADVLDMLARLVDHSLVIAEEHAGESRYRLLETVRQYAAEHLERSGESVDVRARHRDWCLALARRAAPEMEGRPDQLHWLNRLETEHDNIRAALAWSMERDDIEAGLLLAGELWLFWEFRGHLAEGSAWLTELLKRASRKPIAMSSRAHALLGAGSLTLRLGDLATARSLLEDSITCYRVTGDQRQVANELNNLGNVLLEQGDIAAARPLYEEALVIKRGLGEEATIPATLNNLAIVAALQADYAAAHRLNTECLALRREQRDRVGIASTLFNLGRVVQLQGDDGQAAGYFRESLVLSNEMGERRIVAWCLEGIGYVAGARGLTEPAVRLFAAATAVREAIRSPLLPPEDSRLEQTLSGLRDAFGQQQFAASWTAGQALSLDHAIAEALQVAADIARGGN
jgi:non-specific serine/threonine protein kinase